MSRTLASKQREIEAYLKQEMERQHIPGLSVAVLSQGELLFAQGYGLANVELAVAATEQTRYELASVTKPFTATAIMLLVEDGKLDLEQTISHYLPETPLTWHTIVLSHLLNHTSGIRNYLEIDEFRSGDAFCWSLEVPQDHFFRIVSSLPLDFAPGSQTRYSNTGYYLLGMIIEQASGKSYEQFLIERIFEPLGMTATRCNSRKAILPQRAAGYCWHTEALCNAEYTSMTWAYAEGGLISTALDMAQWDRAMTTSRLLPPARLQQMWKPMRLTNGQHATYGFAWAVESFQGRNLVTHDGGKPGFSTFHAHFLDNQLSVILLINRDQVPIRELGEALVETIH